MLKDKSFNVAFLISLLWHLMLVFCVTVVILPANIRVTKPSAVSFLGTILEKTSFEIMLGRKAGAGVSGYKEPVNIDKRLFNSMGEEMAKLNKVSFNAESMTVEKGGRQASTNELFGDFKFTPQFHTAYSGAGYKTAGLTQSFLAGGDNISIEGPLAAQELLFKPELPIIPRRIEPGEGPLAVKLKIKALKNGEIGSVALLVPSGEPMIDLAMINYVNKFKFSPLSSRITSAADWGIIKIKFENR